MCAFTKKLQRVKNLISTCIKRANYPTPPSSNLNGWLCVNVHWPIIFIGCFFFVKPRRMGYQSFGA